MEEKLANPWAVHSTKVTFDNPWIQLVTHNVSLKSNGRKGNYTVVHFKNIAIGVLALDAEKNTYLIGQYRFPLRSYSWEIPEGGCPEGEAPLNAAKRELLEEAGIKARKWTKILKMHLSNSVSDEQSLIFLAEDLEFGNNEPEDTEVLQMKKIPFEQAYEMVINGEITDSIAVAAILRVKIMLSEQPFNVYS